MKHNKIVFIVPYYGKFPDYFREWVYTAGFLEGQDIDFLLITDIEIPFTLPGNIHKMKMTFAQFQKKVQDKFDFKIGLSTPYKICDFKATLGYIFEEEIKDYSFWGNCDIDQVWGNVRKFITDDILNTYDRIQFLGHFILYRNCEAMNRLFMMPGAIYDYKKVLSDEMHYSFCEHSGMMKIVVDNHVSNYLAINYADLSPRYTRMIVSRRDNYDYQIMYWENGHVYRSFVDYKGGVQSEEFMYFHYQRKHPKSMSCWSEDRSPKRFIFRADSFIEVDAVEVTTDYIKQYADFKSNENDRKEEQEYLKNKIQQFFRAPMKKKILWIKQRAATRYVIRHEEYFGRNYSNV